MAQKGGRLSQMWTNLKKSIVIFRIKDNYIGSDELGNKYFESSSDTRHNIKSRRRVEAKDPDQFTVPTVPVEWMTWLQGRRADPPTQQERDVNKMIALKTQSRVVELEKKRMEEDAAVNEDADKTETKQNIGVTPSSSQQQQQQQQKSGSFPIYPGFESIPGDQNTKKH